MPTFRLGSTDEAINSVTPASSTGHLRGNPRVVKLELGPAVPGFSTARAADPTLDSAQSLKVDGTTTVAAAAKPSPAVPTSLGHRVKQLVQKVSQAIKANVKKARKNKRKQEDSHPPPTIPNISVGALEPLLDRTTGEDGNDRKDKGKSIAKKSTEQRKEEKRQRERAMQLLIDQEIEDGLIRADLMEPGGTSVRLPTNYDYE